MQLLQCFCFVPAPKQVHLWFNQLLDSAPYSLPVDKSIQAEILSNCQTFQNRKIQIDPNLPDKLYIIMESMILTAS